MGLPRALEKYVELYNRGTLPMEMAFNIGRVCQKSQYLRFAIPKSKRESISNKHVAQSLLKYFIKTAVCCYAPYEWGVASFSDCENGISMEIADPLDRHRDSGCMERLYEKIPVMVFRHHEKENGKWKAYGFEYMVNRYYAEKIEELSYSRMTADLKMLEARDEIEKIRTIEQGRTYKGRLRQIIMERDEYKCVLCGKSAKDGVTLEVDHIKAWEDGGKTTYDNGRTVCAECNKGLHWAKKFNEKLKDAAMA